MKQLLLLAASAMLVANTAQADRSCPKGFTARTDVLNGKTFCTVTLAGEMVEWSVTPPTDFNPLGHAVIGGKKYLLFTQVGARDPRVAIPSDS